MFPRAVLLLAALVLVPLHVGVGSAPGFAPSAVAALPVGGSVFISWVPGAEPADAFRVYGISESGALALLAETARGDASGALAVVPAGFAGYAVSGVRGDVESGPVMAFIPCVYVQTEPPGVGEGDCPDRVRFALKFFLP